MSWTIYRTITAGSRQLPHICCLRASDLAIDDPRHRRRLSRVRSFRVQPWSGRREKNLIFTINPPAVASDSSAGRAFTTHVFQGKRKVAFGWQLVGCGTKHAHHAIISRQQSRARRVTATNADGQRLTKLSDRWHNCPTTSPYQITADSPKADGQYEKKQTSIRSRRSAIVIYCTRGTPDSWSTRRHLCASLNFRCQMSDSTR